MSLDLYIETYKTCPHCGGQIDGDEIFSKNITDNLTAMAEEAGLYKVLWSPEENGIERASQLIEPLKKGIAEMKADPSRFEKHNAANGWGLYKHFLPWLEEVLRGCEQYPEGIVRASR